MAVCEHAGRSWWRLAGLVLALVVVWLAMRVVFFEGFWGVDDLRHVRFALAWDRPPADHWETRLPFNAMLWASFRLFEFSEASAALPSLLGSLLMLLSGVAVSWRFWRSLRITACVGLLLAVLPGDVLASTTPGARILATGFFCLGATLLMTRRGWPSLVGGGVLMGLAIWTHLFVMFYVSIVLLCVAWMRQRPWRQVAVGLGIAVATFAGPSMAIDAAWTGDPLHSFHIAQKSHLDKLEWDENARHLRDEHGRLDAWFFARPVADFLVSKDMNLLGLAAVVGGVAVFRRARPGLKAVAASALLGWLWMSYGTQSPTEYQPFPGTTAYWQPLSFLVVLTAAGGLVWLRSRWATAVVAGLVAVSIVTAALSGPWGQGVKNSRLLLAYVKAHPADSFVGDDRTLVDMYVFNGLSMPDNVFAVPGDRAEIRKLAPPLGTSNVAGVIVMTNPMRDRTFDTTTSDWIAAHQGSTLHTGPAGYRPIGYLLPESLRTRYNWLIRREPYALSEFRSTGVSRDEGVPPATDWP